MKTHSANHKQTTGVSDLMCQVLYALVPGTLVYAWLLNAAIFLQIILCSLSCVIAEALILRSRRQPVLARLSDGSAVLAGWLLALAIPPIAPWWIAVIGGLVAMSLGKHLYGGLGHNPFNPAMVGYAFLLVSFPLEMTIWPIDNLASLSSYPGIVESTFAVLGLGADTSADWDALTRATPLDRLKQASIYTNSGNGSADLSDIYGTFGLHVWEWINIAWLTGGIWLLWRRTISWQIPVFMLIGLLLSQFLIWWHHDADALNPFTALFAGSTMLGAFFIATDPVSSATTSTGKIIYALGIGVLTSVIRQYSSYPEGIAFAVLLMNCIAPALDHYCKRQGRT